MEANLQKINNIFYKGMYSLRTQILALSSP